MQTHRQTYLTSRRVSDFGETLVVRDFEGLKALTDPCDENVFVEVPVGRRANLVRYSFNGFPGRDAHVVVTRDSQGLGFALAKHPFLHLSLQSLREGQQVDVLPFAEPAVAYAALFRPLPVLHGAIAVEPAYVARIAA